MFQHTAARRRLPEHGIIDIVDPTVSTHSRTKAAAGYRRKQFCKFVVSTHSRTKAAAVM